MTTEMIYRTLPFVLVLSAWGCGQPSDPQWLTIGEVCSQNVVIQLPLEKEAGNSQNRQEIVAQRAHAKLTKAVRRCLVRNHLTQDEIKKGAEALAPFVARTLGVSDRQVEDTVKREMMLLEYLVALYSGEERKASFSHESMSSYRKLFPSKVSAEKELQRMQNAPNAASALFGPTAKELYLSVAAAKQLEEDDALATSEAEVDSRVEARRQEGLPSLSRQDVETLLKVEKAASIVSRYICDQVQSHHIEIFDDDVKEDVLHLLCKT